MLTEWYEHKHGSNKGESTQHVHYIGAVGSTTHKHPNTGPHVHEREARQAIIGGEHVQTGFEYPEKLEKFCYNHVVRCPQPCEACDEECKGKGKLDNSDSIC
jgi:hypothetical protein